MYINISLPVLNCLLPFFQATDVAARGLDVPECDLVIQGQQCLTMDK